MSRSRKKHRRLRRGRPGDAPGTLNIPPGAEPPKLTVIAYGPAGVVEHPVAQPEDLPPLLDRHPVTWVDVSGLGDARFLERLAKVFNLHHLALEDVVNLYQRPKVEAYGDTLFIVVRVPALSQEHPAEQLSLFLGSRFVLTFQEHAGDCFDPVRARMRNEAGRMRNSGPDYLAYALLDSVVDQYFPMLEAFSERLDQLEDVVVQRPAEGTVAAVLEAKRDVLAIRRAIWPLRDVFHALTREPSPVVQAETQIYFRDCYDHAMQALEIADGARDVAAGLLDVYLSTLSNRMNEVMKVLTMFAAIFIPLTFIAGIYGMNFNPDASPWNMPELNWRWGYPGVMLAMLAMAGGMLFFFRRRNWF